MNSNVTIVIAISVSLIFIILGILLRNGKLDAWVNGGFFMWLLWRKYDTYNIPAVTKLTGNMFLAIAVLALATGLSSIFDVEWLTNTFVIFIITIFVVCMIYINRNSRFRKPHS